MSLSAEAGRERDDRAAALVPGDPYASDPARPATSARRPRWRWLFVLPGLAAGAYGLVGLLTAGPRVPLRSVLTWFVGSALLNDVVLAPVWIGLGWLAIRFLPQAARPALTVGFAVTGLLTLVALPFVLGYGADPGNASFLPRDYGRNLVLLDGGVLVLASLWAIAATLRAGRPTAHTDDPATDGPAG
jgi:hypothetical protein